MTDRMLDRENAPNRNDEDVAAALTAVIKLMVSPDQREKLLDSSQTDDLLNSWKVAPAARGRLLQIADRLDQMERASSLEVNHADTGEVTDPWGIADTVRDSFVHIRYSFWVSLAMSVVMFVVGLALIILAVVRSLGEGDASTSTLVIAGLGISDFVLLFYTRPWQDVSANLANTQRAKIVAMSYFSSCALIRDERGPELIEVLDTITQNAIGQLRGGESSASHDDG